MKTRYFGSCLCGVIKFEIDEFLPDVAHCHCSMCRKFHGAAFATIASVEKSKFHWISGKNDIKEYVAKNKTTRSFCNHCGSSLFFSSPKAANNIVEIALSSVSSSVPIKPNAHIFVDSCANWTRLNDDLPKYRDGRTSEEVDF